MTHDVDGNLVPLAGVELDDVARRLDLRLPAARRSVTFQDGSPVTADDVAFSFNRYVDPDLGNVFAYQLASALTSVTADERRRRWRSC